MSIPFRFCILDFSCNINVINTTAGIGPCVRPQLAHQQTTTVDIFDNLFIWDSIGITKRRKEIENNGKIDWNVLRCRYISRRTGISPCLQNYTLNERPLPLSDTVTVHLCSTVQHAHLSVSPNRTWYLFINLYNSFSSIFCVHAVWLCRIAFRFRNSKPHK